MRKILFALSITTFLVACTSHQEENFVSPEWQTEIDYIPVSNIQMQPDEFRENLQRLPDPPAIDKTQATPYMESLARKIRKELRSTGAQVKEVNGQIDLIIPNKAVFGANQTKIQPKFSSALSSVCGLLKEYDRTMIQIVGYTDNTDSVLNNQKISLKKADAVADFLKQNGVNPERIITDGAGPDNPVGNNETPSGREMNRRIEITLINLQ